MPTPRKNGSPANEKAPRKTQAEQQELFARLEVDRSHKVSKAMEQFGTKARIAKADKRPPCAEVAAMRIRQALLDQGRQKNFSQWMAGAARDAGLNPTTARAIIHGKKVRVGPDVVDQIARATGCPIAVFYDPEF